jgi:hypothetical protein
VHLVGFIIRKQPNFSHNFFAISRKPHPVHFGIQISAVLYLFSLRLTSYFYSSHEPPAVQTLREFRPVHIPQNLAQFCRSFSIQVEKNLREQHNA